MIKAILFDMDDTLLDVNLPVFIADYHRGLCKILGAASRRPAPSFALPLVRAAVALENRDRTDDLTNAQLFGHVVKQTTGVDWFLPELHDALEYYDREMTPLMNTSLVNARPMPGAHALVAKALDLGLEIALATNPTFTEGVIRARMGWGDLCAMPFRRVSFAENSTRAKPGASYYVDFVNKCGWKPEECLMVGNDRRRDFPTPDIGIKTLFVGRGKPRKAYWHGSTLELSRQLPRILDSLQ